MNENQDITVRKVKGDFYVLYNSDEDCYYDIEGYESDFLHAERFDKLEDVLRVIEEDFEGYNDKSLSHIEIHKFECQLSEIIKRKVEYITVFGKVSE